MRWFANDVNLQHHHAKDYFQHVDVASDVRRGAEQSARFHVALGIKNLMMHFEPLLS